MHVSLSRRGTHRAFRNAMLVCQDLTFAAGKLRVEGVSLAVERGKYAVLMGPTGCGKTSLLEVICGLRPALRGDVYIDDECVTRQPPGLRGVGYVPQDAAVFRRLTVFQNLAFGLIARRTKPARIKQVVHQLADELSIESLLDRRAQNLSGGEAQRVALGRALAIHPGLLVLDEPLSALDETTRDQMVGLLKRVQREHNVSVLHVTHSNHEAEELGDRRFIFDGGMIRDLSSSTQHIESPAPHRPHSPSLQTTNECTA